MAGGNFNLQDYEEVKDRLPKFWAAHPGGRIFTDMIKHDEDLGVVVFKASLYRDGETSPFATGWARELKGDGFVNKTSHVENCETSAIGRAVANGMLLDGSMPRPSREEMSKTTKAAGSRARRPEVNQELPSKKVDGPAASTNDDDDLHVEVQKVAARAQDMGVAPPELLKIAAKALNRAVSRGSDLTSFEDVEAVSRALDALETKEEAF